MKIKYLIPACMATLALATVSCTSDDEMPALSTATVSNSYVSISPDGGSAKITINANEDWALDYEVKFETDSLDAEKGKVNFLKEASQMELKNDKVDNTWIKVSPAKGSAGSTEITFTADKSAGDRQSTLKIKIGDTYQTVVVAQKAAAEELKTSTVKDVVVNGADSKTYRVSGPCTTIANTTYGNWYMVDEEGNSLYIYGTVDASGSYNWSSFHIEPGDIVTVEGSRTTYNGTVELVDAAFIKVEKALISTKDNPKTIEQTATPFTVTVTQKGKGLKFASKSDWMTIDGGYSVDKNGNYVFTVVPEANETGKNRKGILEFVSTSGTKSSTLLVEINQLATASVPSTVFALAEQLKGSKDSKNPVLFYVELKDAKVTYKAGSNIFIEDATGGLCLYSSTSKLKVGDVINGKVWGSGYTYNGLPEATAMNTELGTVTDGAEVTPTKVTLAELAANFDKYVSRLVRIEGAKVSKDIDATYQKVVNDGAVTDGTNEFPLKIQSTGTYKEKNLTKGNKGIKMYFYFQAAKDAAVNFTCIPGMYKMTKQLNVYDQEWTK